MSELYVSCPQCASAILDLQEFQERFKRSGCDLFAKATNKDGVCEKARISQSTMTVRCTNCHDRRILLTDEGKRLRELFTLAGDAGVDTPIPF